MMTFLQMTTNFELVYSKLVNETRFYRYTNARLVLRKKYAVDENMKPPK